MLVNKRARRDYEITETLTAGLVLRGEEVKSLRGARGSLRDGFVKLINNEAYLVGMNIPRYSHSSSKSYDAKRSRKLLMSRREILSLQKKMEGKNLTLVPLKVYFKGRWVKVEVGLGRGKREYEKREAKKRKDIEREVEREFRGKLS